MRTKMNRVAWSVCGLTFLAALVPMAALAAPVHYALIDIGVSGQRVETVAGPALWLDDSRSHGDANVNLAPYALTSATGDAFTIAIDNLDTGGSSVGGIDWRDYGDSASGGEALVKLCEDLVKSDEGVVRVTLGSLPAGTYDITSYHVASSGARSNNIWVSVDDDNNGTYVDTLERANAGFNVGGSNGLTNATIIENSASHKFWASYSFTTDGGDVRIVYDGRSGTGDLEVPFNGMDIKFTELISGTLTSLIDGFWDLPDTWAGNVVGGVPTNGTNVIIDNDDVTVRAENPPGTALVNVAREVDVEATGGLIIEPGAELIVSGDVNVLGSALIEGALSGRSITFAAVGDAEVEIPGGGIATDTLTIDVSPAVESDAMIEIGHEGELNLNADLDVTDADLEFAGHATLTLNNGTLFDNESLRIQNVTIGAGGGGVNLGGGGNTLTVYHTLTVNADVTIQMAETVLTGETFGGYFEALNLNNGTLDYDSYLQTFNLNAAGGDIDLNGSKLRVGGTMTVTADTDIQSAETELDLARDNSQLHLDSGTLSYDAPLMVTYLSVNNGGLQMNGNKLSVGRLTDPGDPFSFIGGALNVESGRTFDTTGEIRAGQIMLNSGATMNVNDHALALTTGSIEGSDATLNIVGDGDISFSGGVINVGRVMFTNGTQILDTVPFGGSVNEVVASTGADLTTGASIRVLTVDSGGTLHVATDQQTINVRPGGTLNLNAGSSMHGLNVSGGMVNMADDVETHRASLVGGTVDTSGHDLVVTDLLLIGETRMDVSGGLGLAARGANLTEKAELLTFQGGTVTMGGQEPALVYYSFDDIGNPGNDDSGNNHHAVPWGEAMGTDIAKFGAGALTLDGDGDYLTADGVNGVASAINGGDFAILAWVHTEVTGKGYALGFHPADYHTDEIYRAGLNSDTTEIYSLTAGADHPSGVDIVDNDGDQNRDWHQIGWQFDAGTSTAYIIVDGTIQGPIAASPVVPNNAVFTIGQEWDGANNPSDFWQGLVDEVYVYGKLLDASTVLQMYQGSFGGSDSLSLPETDLLVTHNSTLAYVADSSMSFRDLTVESSIRFTIEGASGVVFYDVTVEDGGTIDVTALDDGLTVSGTLMQDPATGESIGEMTVDGDLSFVSGSAANFEFDSDTCDLLVVMGDLHLDGTLTVDGELTEDSYLIIEYGGTLDGSTFSDVGDATALGYWVNYLGNPNEVYLTKVVPEPGTIVLLITGLAALGWYRWRRRRS